MLWMPQCIIIILLERLNWRLQGWTASSCWTPVRFSPFKAPARYSLSFITSNAFSRRFSLMLIFSPILQAQINEGFLYIWKRNGISLSAITHSTTKLGRFFGSIPSHASGSFLVVTSSSNIPERQHQTYIHMLSLSPNTVCMDDGEQKSMKLFFFWLCTHFSLPLTSQTSWVTY